MRTALQILPMGGLSGPCMEKDSEVTGLGPYVLPLLFSALMVTLAKGSHQCRKQRGTELATSAYGRMHARHLLFCFKSASRTWVWKWYMVKF